jgi:sigma-B regulation protein RsbU (phosphoserine phosphatase)
VLRASGEEEWLRPTAPVIGVMPSIAVETAEVRLLPGDRLAVYSDGVTDARNGHGGELGEHGFVEEFRRAADLSPQLLAARIAAYSPGEQFDDMTLVLARVL